MARSLFVLLALVVGVSSAHAQQSSVLHISVSLLDQSRQRTPVPHHALLISEELSSTVPRRVVTGADGRVDVKLRPGRYTVESDQPVAFQGRVYQWTAHVVVAPDRDLSLELDSANAEGAAPTSAKSLETDPAFLLNEWSGSVVGVWTPLVHASGVLVDAVNGVVVTSVHVGAPLSDVEVQLTRDTKVRARVIRTDPKTDVAILQIDPSASASIAPLAFDCGASAPAIAAGQDLVAIVAPPLAAPDLVMGAAVAGVARTIGSDLRVRPDSAGGPVFAGARLDGITAMAATGDEHDRIWASRNVGVDDVCSALASAGKGIHEGAPPPATHLPVDPAGAVASSVLQEIVSHRAGSLGPPQMAFDDFDVAFITPVHTFGARNSPAGATRQRIGAGIVDLGSPALRPVRDFANWSDYVEQYLPVLLVRATPKLAEGFWSAVARGAAQTRGVPLPAIRRAKASFARMRVFCGEREVAPIHPFIVEQRLSKSEAILEGLYAFDPKALGPECGTVALTVYSGDSDKGDTRQIDPQIIQTIGREFTALLPPRPKP
jgi:S1-C subfamily serine protease